MEIQKKIDKWVENELITKAQGDSILKFEQSYNNGIFGKTAFIIAGLLIGIGICLIIASNWDETPTFLKVTGCFGMLGAFSYNAYKNVLAKNEKLMELFLILAFLMVGATIGLFGQIFNLDGGFNSFCTGWALLGTPYVLFSKSVRFNIVWGILLFRIWNIFELLDTLLGSFIIVIWFVAMSFIFKIFDDKFGKFSKLPIGMAKLLTFMSYVIVFMAGIRWGLDSFFFRNNNILNTIMANVLVFGFLGGYMLFAVKKQNIDLFKRNTVLLEIWIFILFARSFGNLFMNGIGFILGGLAILGMIKILKKTSKFIQNMEAFNE